jgi:hypothetical protein
MQKKEKKNKVLTVQKKVENCDMKMVGGSDLFLLVHDDLELFKDNKGHDGVRAQTQEGRKPALEEGCWTFALDNMEKHLCR